MPVSEIKPGMKGYGLTVFEGTRPERFDVEIINVLEKALPKQDMILIRVSGHGLEESGIYQGMSGSPIFIDNRVVGALAYGWSFTKMSIAGVTPIKDMLAELNRPLENSQAVALVEDGSRNFSYRDGQFVPVASPVTVSGLPPSLMGELTDLLKPYHLVPLQGGAGSEPAGKAADLKPGSALGVTMVRGDIDMTAVGTVTWVEGSRVLAFGHPFLNGGEIRFPITSAKILALLPRLSISSKMGVSTGEIGGLVQDRQSCVLGDLRSKVRMVPYDIHVKNRRTGREESLHMEMAWVTNFTTRLMPLLLRAGLDYAEANAGENTAQCAIEVTFKGYPPFVLKNTYFNNRGPFNKMMVLPLIKMIYNPFEKVEIESLKISVDVDPQIRIAIIKRMWMEEDEISPGGTGRLHVVLAPFGSDEVEKVVEVRIEENAEPGMNVMLGAAGGMVVLPPVAPPVDFPGIMKIFKSLYKFTDLVVVQQLSSTGARIEGYYMPDLPPAAIRILGTPNSTGPMITSDFRMTPVHTDWVILGQAALQVKVGQKY